MRKLYKMLTLVAFLVLLVLQTQAVPAYPGIITQKNSDGTELQYRLYGDEDFSWAKTLDGYTIMRDHKGDYVYMVYDAKGDLMLSSVIAHNEEDRSAAEKLFVASLKPHMFFSAQQMELVRQIAEVHKAERSVKSFPTTGNRKLICILMQYPDRLMVKTREQFNALFNTIGYNLEGANGSVKDYYLEVSYNQFNLTVDVAGPYTAANNMAYYRDRASTLVREGVLAANPTIDFSQYDNDNDGYVDAVYMIFAGYGREAGGPDAAIWSHASNVNPAVLVDGKYVQRYSCSPELRGNSGTSISNIGVICHEFGHVLGALDYYDTNYETGGQYEGTGSWDMMAGGSWNDNGRTPAHHNGFTKTVVYNWSPVVTLSQPLSVTMQSATEFPNNFYRINTTTSGEYFLLESRFKVGFDAAIPGTGLIIYRVHSGVFQVGNQINATHPQRMYPVAQNASVAIPTSTPSSYGSINTASCAWTGVTGTKTAFTDNSVPSMKSWAGVNTNKPITNISRNAIQRTVSFDFMGGEGNPTIFTATPVSGREINIEWNPTTVDYMILAYSPTGIFGTPTNGTNYEVGATIPGGGTVIYAGTATSFLHTGLIPASAHYYKIWARKSTSPIQYSSGTSTWTYTLCETIDRFPYTENFGTRLKPSCFEIIDVQGSGQVWRFDNPSNRPLASTTGSNGIAILDSRYFGEGNTQNAHLVTGTFDFGEYLNVQVSFEHHYKHTNSSAKFSYSIDGGNTWVDVATYTADVGTLSAPATATFNLSSALSQQRNVRFRWSYTATYGFYWCIDDFVVNATQRAAISITYNGTDYFYGDKIVDYQPVVSPNTKNYQLTINSIGDIAVNLSNLTLNSSKYTITQAPASVINPGQSSNMTIQYAPTTPGTDTVVLSFNNNTALFNPFLLVIKSNVATQYNATFALTDGINPVEGASVSLTGYGQQTSNSNGIAIFANVQAGTDIPVTITKEGFNTYTGTIRLIDANQTFNITLRRSNVAITFRLLREDGTPLTNSSVIVQGFGQQLTSGGQTTFTLPPMLDIFFTCMGPGHQKFDSTLNTDVADRLVVINMKLIRYSVTVTVRSGVQPVINANVTLGDYGTRPTNENGQAVFTGVLPALSIPLTVTADGYETHTESVRVSNSNVAVNVNLVVGIDQYRHEWLTVYPNPVRDLLMIQNEGETAPWAIMDISGRIIHSGKLSIGSNPIDVSILSQGVYFLNVQTSLGKAIYKMVKID